MAINDVLRQVLRPVRAIGAARHPAVLVAGALVGLGLMIGAPLIAQDHHAEEPATEARPVESHQAQGGEGTDQVLGHAAGEAEHAVEGEGHGEKQGVQHFPSLVVVIASAIEGTPVHAGAANAAHIHNPVARNLILFEDVIYSAIIIVLLSLLFYRATRRLELVPGRLQNFVEFLVEGLDSFIGGVIGPEGRKFVPFLGTLGLYIYAMNIFGIVPLMKSPTSVLNTTAAMAICVFLYVQWTGFRTNGVVGYLKHLAGDPKDAIGWGMVPLMLPLHVIGELAKPLSLSLRLFGNIMGEELLLAVFAGLGVGILAFSHLPFGVPLHVPFLFLGLLTTLIQAVVFMLLSTIYIALVLPHHDHGEHGHEAHH